MRTIGFLLLLLSWFAARADSAAAAAPPGAAPIDFPKPLEDYHDDEVTSLPQKLVDRVRAEPFNLVGTLIFLCAILHTFLTSKFMHISHGYQSEFAALEGQGKGLDPSSVLLL